jgi:transmembrane sensor
MALEDGSVVELKPGTQIETRFTAEVRSVRLIRGEGYFSVAKDPARPFVVTADRIDVRALGTEFCVTLNPSAVSVLVTEGKVRVDTTPRDAVAVDRAAPRELSQVAAGQRAMIQLAPIASAGASATDSLVELRDITPAEIERALAWQGLRLEFIELPLRDVVREFNRFNVRKLVVADDATGATRIGGSFRADNVESFVRLLVTGFGMTADTQDNEIVLRYARAR